MSSLAKSGISISKKLLPYSRGHLYFKTVCFYHQAELGETAINIEALVMPTSLTGVAQASIQELYAMGLFYNAQNLLLMSFAKQRTLVRGFDYIIDNALEITLIGPDYAAGTEEDEVFVAQMLAVPQENINALIERLEKKPAVPLAALDVDWSLGFVFTKSITANSAFTFSNTLDGRVITLSVKNTSGSNVTITLPTGVWRDTGIDLTVEAGKKNIYTFIKEGSEISCSYLSRLVLV